jgi:hypothetical protein
VPARTRAGRRLQALPRLQRWIQPAVPRRQEPRLLSHPPQVHWRCKSVGHSGNVNVQFWSKMSKEAKGQFCEGQFGMLGQFLILSLCNAFFCRKFNILWFFGFLFEGYLLRCKDGVTQRRQCTKGRPHCPRSGRKSSTGGAKKRRTDT